MICSRVGLELDRVPRMHVTSPTHWSTVLTGSALERAHDYYRDDLRMLGYDDV